MKTGWESMWVGSIIYFIPFFFVLNPALVMIEVQCGDYLGEDDIVRLEDRYGRVKA